MEQAQECAAVVPLAVKPRKKARSGATAMKHARAILEHDGYTYITAGKRIVRKPDGTMFALPEDLFGCFDAFAIAPGHVSRLIQVTSQPVDHEGGAMPTAVKNRMAKIRAWVNEHVKATAEAPLAEQLELWAWVNGRHFRRWAWLWQGLHWHELEPLPSPLLASRPR